MRSIKTLLLLLMFSFLFLNAEGQIKKALIIVNSDYSDLEDLNFSIVDSDNLTLRLINIGYKVSMVRNVNNAQMKQALNDFFREDGSISLLYYAGHTYKSGYDDRVFLVPTDAKSDHQYAFGYDAITVNHIGYQSANPGSKQNILIFDTVCNWQNGQPEQHLLSAASENSNAKNTIVLANNNLSKQPDESSFLFELLINEINPNKSIYSSIANIQQISNENNNSNVAIKFGEFPHSIKWGGNQSNVGSTFGGNSNNEISTSFESSKAKRFEPGAVFRIMPSFPFPPPKASTSYMLDKAYFNNVNNLFTVSEVIDSTLKACGYLERSYYQIPDGFALVTRIEKINTDASPLPKQERWNAPFNKSDNDFSIADYFRSLFTAEVGKYRILVFLVTSIPFNQTQTEVTIAQAQEFLKSGLNALPKKFKSLEFTTDHNCTALIYEFEKAEFEGGRLIEHSEFTGFDHLNKNNFLPILNLRNR